ncbi:C39 family peptidase [Massilia sp. PWRC2]|uniref:C39 family peptidase n=1 Tax=Massilia sp. PWRC2 TaxID=2804626 RepID=UPI003CEFF818
MACRPVLAVLKTALLGAALGGLGPNASALDLSLGGGRFNVPVTSLKAVRFAHTLHQQYDFSCGSAAVATLLTFHYGTPIDERTVFSDMFVRGDQAKIRREGFSLLDIKRFLERRGFTADGFRQPLQKLLDAELPAIVLIAEKGYQHFVVIQGAADGRILLGDPATGTRAMARAAFEQLWTNKLLFLIHGSPQRPLFNQPEHWRAAPAAPLDTALYQDALRGLALGRNGPGDY